MHRGIVRAVLIGVVGVSAAACLALGCEGAKGGSASDRVGVEGPGPVHGAVRIVDAPTSSPSDAEKSFHDGAPSRRTIFLQRRGGSYSPSTTDDASSDRSAVIDHSLEIPAYSKTEARWGALVSCVRDELSRWNVEVVESDPGSATHLEVVVGGAPSMAGMDGSVGGLAPLASDGSVTERAVVFVFESVLPTTEAECKITTQEIGHALGLDHEYLCGDPMSDVTGCGHARFQDVDAPCGDDAPRGCIDGAPKQSSVMKLTKKLGPKPGPAPTPPIDVDAGGADAAGDGGAPPPPSDDGGVAPFPDAGDDGGAPTPPDDDGGAPPPPDDGGAPPPPVDDGGVAPSPPSPSPSGGPTISLVSPDDGATLPANTTIDLVAQVADSTASLTSVVLRWTVGGKSNDVDCASPPMEVTCDASAGKYTWHVPVGSGPRTWSVVAVDAAGAKNESPVRALTLSSSPSPSPTPTPPPPPSPSSAITIDQPTEGATIHAGDTVTVTATGSTKAFGAMWLRWSSPSGDKVNPMKHASGTTWSLDLDISSSAPPGSRTIHVYGLDASGTKTDAPDRHVTIGG